MNAHFQRGFSLLELLVVFVMVAMVSVLIVQGLGFGLSLYERVKSRGPALVSNSMAHSWYRQVNASLIAQKEKGKSLIGDAKNFSAQTLNPLIADKGLPTNIHWRLDQGWLYYLENEHQIPILSYEVTAKFEYLDKNGSWTASWPIDRDGYDLPRAIRVNFDEESLTASVIMRTEPDLLLEESRLDRK